MNITGNALVVGGGKYLLGSTVTTITDIGILILTGRGIGQACAILLAKEGVSGILVADMVVEAAKDTISECQAVATNRQFQGKAFPVDVTQEDSVRSLFNEMTSAFGRIDYCVNCAGALGPGKDSTSTSLEEFDKVNAVNYRGCWLTSRAQLKAMMRQDPLPSHDARRPAQRGAIVNIASQLGIVGRPNAGKWLSSVF